MKQTKAFFHSYKIILEIWIYSIYLESQWPQCGCFDQQKNFFKKRNILKKITVLFSPTF